MAKKAYYAIYNGRSKKPLIVNTWDECKAETQGVSCVAYKKFTTEEEALQFLLEKSRATAYPGVDEPSIAVNDSEDSINIYVDGSYLTETGDYSYGLVAVKNDVSIYEDCSQGYEEAAVMRNVAGEILGAMKAVEWAYNQGYKQVLIHYDYVGISEWAVGTWKRNNTFTKRYHDYMKSMQDFINIKFVKVKGHSGDKWNDYADKLAKHALGIV